MYGFQGTMLIVDLTQGKVLTEKLDERFTRNHIGGVGFGIRLLYDRLEPGVDPLSPENMLVFASGPLSALGFMGSTGMSIVSKSPLTELIGDSDLRELLGLKRYLDICLSPDLECCDIIATNHGMSF